MGARSKAPAVNVGFECRGFETCHVVSFGTNIFSRNQLFKSNSSLHLVATLRRSAFIVTIDSKMPAILESDMEGEVKAVLVWAKEKEPKIPVSFVWAWLLRRKGSGRSSFDETNYAKPVKKSLI